MGKHSTGIQEIPANPEPIEQVSYSAPASAASSVTPRAYGAIACLVAAASLGVVAVASNPEAAPAFANVATAPAPSEHRITVATAVPVRTATYSLTVDGKTTEHTTAALTWVAALKEAGVKIGGDDILSVSMYERPEDGDAVTIKRVTYTTITEENTEEFETIREDDPNLEKGKEEVRTEGVNGHVQTTFRVTLVDGVETEKERQVTVRSATKVNKVIAVGTKEPEPEPTPEPVEAAAQPQERAAAPAAEPAPAPEPAPVQVSAGGARGIAQQMLAARGWGADQFSCLDRLWMRESNWNHLAMNPSSGAYGIPQALPGGKMASHGADWRTNPATQIAWGLDYIAGRYGTPCGALNHSYARGWY